MAYKRPSAQWKWPCAPLETVAVLSVIVAWTLLPESLGFGFAC